MKKIIGWQNNLKKMKTNNNMDTINIVSKSKIKIESIKEVFGKNYNYKIFDSFSEANVQLVGFKEIIDGADKRLDYVRNITDMDDITISIENGIVDLDFETYDISYIIMMKGNEMFTSWSNMIPIGDINIDPKKVSVGEIISPENYIDFQSTITNGYVSRKDTLKQALNVIKGIYLKK